MKKIILISTLVLAISGCASSMNIGSRELTCKAAPGLGCTGMRQAWEQTNDYLPGDKLRTDEAKGSSDVSLFSTQVIQNISVIDTPKPILMPAQVMRVWINAYQDENGGLVYPSHVFVQVTPRQWNVGHTAAQGVSSRRVSPLVVHSSVVDDGKQEADAQQQNREDLQTKPDALSVGVIQVPLNTK